MSHKDNWEDFELSAFAENINAWAQSEGVERALSHSIFWASNDDEPLALIIALRDLNTNPEVLKGFANHFGIVYPESGNDPFPAPS